MISFQTFASTCIRFCRIAGIVAVVVRPQLVHAEQLDVEVKDRLLTLSAVEATYEDIYRTIAQKAGISASLQGDLGDRVTIAFEHVEIDYALQRMTRDGFALILVTRKDTSNPSQTRVIAFDLFGPETNDPDNRTAPRVVTVVSETESSAHKDAGDRQQLQRLTGMVDAETMRQLNDILQQSPDPAARKQALRMLGEMPHDKALAVIEQGLSDGDETVRITALEIMAGKDTSNIDLLLGQTLFGDRSAVLRDRAVELLGNRDTDAARAFLATVEQETNRAVHEKQQP